MTDNLSDLPIQGNLFEWSAYADRKPKPTTAAILIAKRYGLAMRVAIQIAEQRGVDGEMFQ